MSGAKSPPKSPSKSTGAKTPVPASPKKEEAKPVEEVVAPTPVVIDPRSVKTLNTIQSQLRDAQSNGGSSQATLYSHLTEVFNRCI